MFLVNREDADMKRLAEQSGGCGDGGVVVCVCVPEVR